MKTILGVPLRPRAITLTETVSVELMLVGDDVDLDAHQRELFETDYAPFWAFCWAGGQALARFVLEHPAWVHGRCVVDFGAGSGIAGIAAAHSGANRVIAIDLDSQAREACLVNAERNGVQLEVGSELPTSCDIILAADVLYDDDAGAIQNLLRSHAAAVLLSDPGRASSPALPESPLACYDLQTVPDVDPPMRRAFVYHLGEKPELERVVL